MSDAGEERPEQSNQNWVRPPIRKESNGYFARHWRGELSLAHSFWVNVFLVNVLLRIVTKGILSAPFAAWSTQVRLVSVLVLVVISGGFAIWIWQIVGTWRAAERNVTERGRKFWARVAQVVIVLGTLSTFGSLASDWPAIGEYMKLAVGNDRFAEFSVFPSDDGTELHIVGGIGLGLTSEVREDLERNPGIGVITLENDGGRTGEARALYELIRERGLDTKTTTRCLSACTVVFIAGKRRILGTGGRLGFHKYSFPGVSEQELGAAERIDRQLFRDAGVDPAFIEKAFASSSRDLWFPSEQELLDAGFVTEIAPLPALASAEAREQLRDMEPELLSNPAIAALKEHERESYDRIMKALGEELKNGATQREIAERVKSEVKALVRLKLQSASGETLVVFSRAMVAALEDMQRQHPPACFHYLFGGSSGSAGGFEYVDKETQDRFFEATGMLIAAPGRGEATFDSERAVRLLSEVTARINDVHGDSAMAAIEKSASTDAEKGRACSYVIDLYSAILALPEQDSGLVLQHLFSE